MRTGVEFLVSLPSKAGGIKWVSLIVTTKDAGAFSEAAVAAVPASYLVMVLMGVSSIFKVRADVKITDIYIMV